MEGIYYPQPPNAGSSSSSTPSPVQSSRPNYQTQPTNSGIYYPQPGDNYFPPSQSYAPSQPSQTQLEQPAQSQSYAAFEHEDLHSANDYDSQTVYPPAAVPVSMPAQQQQQYLQQQVDEPPQQQPRPQQLQQAIPQQQPYSQPQNAYGVTDDDSDSQADSEQLDDDIFPYQNMPYPAMPYANPYSPYSMPYFGGYQNPYAFPSYFAPMVAPHSYPNTNPSFRALATGAAVGAAAGAATAATETGGMYTGMRPMMGPDANQAIRPSEIKQILPPSSDTSVDQDFTKLLHRADRYGADVDNSSWSRRKYTKYVFLSGMLLAKRGLPTVCHPDDPDDVCVKLLSFYLADPLRLGPDSEKILLRALHSHNHRHHHHHHHHHHRHRRSKHCRRKLKELDAEGDQGKEVVEEETVVVLKDKKGSGKKESRVKTTRSRKVKSREPSDESGWEA